MEKELHPYLRVPLLGLYKVAFNCNMTEAEESELKKYTSLQNLFIRKLKEGVRPIDPTHHLVRISNYNYYCYYWDHIMH